jgi:hypothetical protein
MAAVARARMLLRTGKLTLLSLSAARGREASAEQQLTFFHLSSNVFFSRSKHTSTSAEAVAGSNRPSDGGTLAISQSLGHGGRYDPMAGDGDGADLFRKRDPSAGSSKHVRLSPIGRASSNGPEKKQTVEQ